jgi:hypothetical protein
MEEDKNTKPLKKEMLLLHGGCWLILTDADGSYVLSFSGTRSASCKTFISTTDEHVLLPTKHSFLRPIRDKSPGNNRYRFLLCWAVT